MNILAIAGGAAVLVIYLAGRRASKAIADEPPIFGDYADGATGTGGGGYYGGGGGGGDGGLSAGVGTLAPIAAGVQASNGTFGRSSDASKTLAETFAESLGYKQLEKDVAQVDLGSPSGSLERSAASVQMPVASSLQIAAATASATPYASSSLSMSSTPSTAGNASVTAQPFALNRFALHRRQSRLFQRVRCLRWCLRCRYHSERYLLPQCRRPIRS